MRLGSKPSSPVYHTHKARGSKFLEISNMRNGYQKLSSKNIINNEMLGMTEFLQAGGDIVVEGDSPISRKQHKRHTSLAIKRLTDKQNELFTRLNKPEQSKPSRPLSTYINHDYESQNPVYSHNYHQHPQ